MVSVIASYLARPGTADEIAQILDGHGHSSRAEPGCVRFDAFRAVDEPERFWLFEEYVDDAAFQAHRSTPHFRENTENRIVPMLAERSWARVQGL